MKPDKVSENFLIKIVDKQNATWQGSITWLGENKVQHFRSTLELIKLIDSVLEHNEMIGGESHEK